MTTITLHCAYTSCSPMAGGKYLELVSLCLEMSIAQGRDRARGDEKDGMVDHQPCNLYMCEV